MIRPLSVRAISIGLLVVGAFALGITARADTLVEQGRTIATSGSGAAVACVTCHGAKGEGMAAAGFPYLAGQGAGYLALQLHDFASGKRANPIMAPIAKALNADQVKAVAAYFSHLPAPFDVKSLADRVDTYPPKTDMGAWLANRGDWAHDIPACIQCHGPGGVGVSPHFPAIAGLPAKYIHEQLVAWKTHKRDPGPLALMGDIASRMSDGQMTAVADYFSALPTTPAGAAQSTAGAKK
ncbi:MAG TPA: c-type cytochrome [Burkholderiaceae bacterium]|nr:c-type cytochrome [Burkholderiaceae bacterium]